MFRILLQEAFRWIVALGTLAGSGTLIGTVPLLQETPPPLEIELADVEPSPEAVPEIIVQPAQGGISGLAFHPAVMYRGDDECRQSYTVRGSLKNHGSGALEDIQITYVLPSDVDLGPVTLSPESADSLGTSAPLRITMEISTTAAWRASDVDIQIPLTATGKVSNTVVSTATGVVYIYNTCTGEEEFLPDEDDPDPDDDEDFDDDDLDEGMGIAGLAFHPDHLNSGGVCRATYTAQGSLKNHGSAPAMGVTLVYTEPDGFKGSIQLVYDTGYTLTSSKPLRFTVNVSPESDWWNSLGKGASITIQISAQGEDTNVATATMTVRNQCKEDMGNNKQVDDPGAQGKPDKADKETGKPDKADKETGKPDKADKPIPPGQLKDKKK